MNAHTRDTLRTHLKEILGLQTAFREFAGKEIGVTEVSWMEGDRRRYYGLTDLHDAVVQNLRKVFPKCHEYELQESRIRMELGASAESENLARADIFRGEDGRWRLPQTLEFSGFDS